MANEYGGKREEIRGFTVLDIRNINNNFRTLWQTQFGNATYTDQSQALTVKINNIDNKASRVAKDIENHKNSYHFNGEYGDLKNKPETFNPAYTFLSVGGINYLKQGKLIFMQGSVKINVVIPAIAPIAVGSFHPFLKQFVNNAAVPPTNTLAPAALKIERFRSVLRLIGFS